jgi:hypothetical protein
MKIQILGRSGSLCSRTKKKRLANGEEREYPAISGDRDPDRYDHWFWQYTYKERQADGQFRTRTVSVSQQQAPIVRDLIESGAVVARILEFLNSSK